MSADQHEPSREEPSATGLYRNYTSTSVFEGKSEAELTAWSEKYFRAFHARHLPPARDARIIDVGCGYGRYLLALRHLGYTNVSGIDLSEEQVRYARDVLGLDRVTHGNALEHFSGGEVYDAILLFDILEHLDVADTIALKQRAWDSLAPGGVLLIQVPNGNTPIPFILHGDITHKRAYSPRSMGQSCRMAGIPAYTHHALPNVAHGPVSVVRRALWSAVLNPLIAAYMLVVTGSTEQGIYTPNLLTVCRKPAR